MKLNKKILLKTLVVYSVIFLPASIVVGIFTSWLLLLGGIAAIPVGVVLIEITERRRSVVK